MNTRKYFFIDDRPDPFEPWREQFIKLSAQGTLQLEEISKENVKPSDKAILIVTGGDGSLNHAANWLYKKELMNSVHVLYHPDGTGNDFARSVGLRPQDLEQSFALLSAEKVTEIFLGDLNGHLLVNMATCGVFAQVTPDVDSSVKSLLGNWSYYLKGLEKLTQLETFECDFKSDDLDLTEEKVFGFFIGKSRFSGGGMQVTPEQSPTKNSTDFFLVREMPLPDLIALGIEMQKQEPDISEFDVVIRQTKNLSFKAKQKVPISLDGEELELTRGQLKMCPQTLKIYLPDLEKTDT